MYIVLGALLLNINFDNVSRHCGVSGESSKVSGLEWILSNMFAPLLESPYANASMHFLTFPLHHCRENMRKNIRLSLRWHSTDILGKPLSCLLDEFCLFEAHCTWALFFLQPSVQYASNSLNVLTLFLLEFGNFAE